jgi:hypothetical protein
LTYYIREGLLVGVSDDRMFHISALSGGAGGSTKHGTSNAVNNPYMEGLKTKGAAASAGHVHGGPLPPGKYVVHTPAHHPHLGLSARLDHPRFRPMGRDGFYIHGQGPHGSDGCIVPLDRAQFNDLMKALSKSHGGTLVVEETADGTRYA